MKAAGRGLSLLTSVTVGALAAWLASHHPLSPAVAAAACLLMGLLCGGAFTRWPLWLLPWLPLAGLMPWSGWVVVEEWDLLVLAAAAGGYLHLALCPVPDRRGSPSSAPLAWLGLLALAASTAIAAWRGVVDAGGWSVDWWQGYREPLNSIRLGKPVVAVMLLLPLWQGARTRDREAASQALKWGMVGLAAATALPVWWERLAYTGLLDFSTDYRATGLFWEMHVGGAALDAALALSMPFVVLALLSARNLWSGGIAAAVLLLTVYASLVTFSRIVYLAVPVACLLCGGLWLLRRRRSGQTDGDGAPWHAAGLTATFVAAAWWLFPTAGYRGLLALTATYVLVLALPGRRPSARAGAAIALAQLAIVAAATAWVPKGAYLAFAAVWLSGAVALAFRGKAIADSWAAGSVAGCTAGLVAVAWHWGGQPAVLPAVTAATGLALAAAVSGARPGLRWPDSVRWQGLVLVASVGASGVVAVLLGGAYMEERAATVAQDSSYRQNHVRLLLDMLRTPEQRLLGWGLGRTPAQLASSGEADLRVGDARVLGQGADARLVFATGSHIQGWGEMLRVSQRIEAPAPGPLRLRLRVRSDQALSLRAEVCVKHLLYGGSCASGSARLEPTGSAWLPVDMELSGESPGASASGVPRLIAFSLSIDVADRKAELDSLEMIDSAGRSLLVNGEFDGGMGRWFLSSDRHHMPWHAKNLAAHLWFEQGLVGAALAAALFLAAAWRGALGAGRDSALSPALVAGAGGLLVVGLVDSIFDMPRIGFLAWFVVALALASTPGPGPHRAGRSASAKPGNTVGSHRRSDR